MKKMFLLFIFLFGCSTCSVYGMNYAPIKETLDKKVSKVSDWINSAARGHEELSGKIKEIRIWLYGEISRSLSVVEVQHLHKTYRMAIKRLHEQNRNKKKFCRKMVKPTTFEKVEDWFNQEVALIDKWFSKQVEMKRSFEYVRDELNKKLKPLEKRIFAEKGMDMCQKNALTKRYCNLLTRLGDEARRLMFCYQYQ